MTIKKLRKEYTRLRARYYIGRGLSAERDIIFRFVRDGDKSVGGHVISRTTNYAASTRYTAKETGTGRAAIFCELHEDLRKEVFQRMFYMVLMHEMSHMTNWRAECGFGSEWWGKECVRLGSLGAMREFF